MNINVAVGLWFNFITVKKDQWSCVKWNYKLIKYVCTLYLIYACWSYGLDCTTCAKHIVGTTSVAAYWDLLLLLCLYISFHW